MDLGSCSKSHTERPKTDFLAAREADPHNLIFRQFQQEYKSNLFTFVDECDRRICVAHHRLENTPEENAKTTNLMREIAEIELTIQGVPKRLKNFTFYISRQQQLTETSGASEHQKLHVCDIRSGYHELRNLLGQFRAEREARKNAAPSISSGVSSSPLLPPVTATGPRMDDHDRDRDYDYRRDSGRDRGYGDRDRYAIFIRKPGSQAAKVKKT
ncbi:hypothetical protein Clacol_006914 [Clathrus columnatus]|uniref:Uncharacterized protein n=1 Tax=Clathrus columnatus TaxID=1419009 RepID=A0AAV5AL67_9AGAM|nr:hypothetical protein Clacol_006914 [Clathrus columnatus]